MLKRWNTPFTDEIDPSIGLYVEHGADSTDLLSAIIAPGGIDKYPKFLVRFGAVLEFNCYEEAFASGRAYHCNEKEAYSICSFMWESSPNVKAYKDGSLYFVGVGEADIKHYIVIGADNIIEVVTLNEYTIETVTSKKVVHANIEV